MKKLFVIMVLAACTVFLGGCGKEERKEETKVENVDTFNGGNVVTWENVMVETYITENIITENIISEW